MTSSTAAERDPVAQALLGAEDRQQAGPGPRSCRRPTGSSSGIDGRAEVLVVEDRPAGSRRRRAPSAGPAPRRARRATRRAAAGRRSASTTSRHPRQLVRRGRARAARRGPARTGRRPGSRPGRGRPARRSRSRNVGPLGRQPLEQRARVVQRQPDARVALERLDHRQVGLLVDLGEHPAEVADRLVVVDGEGERDAGRPPCASVRDAVSARRPRLAAVGCDLGVGGGRRQVQPLDVLVEHAGRREPPDRAGDRVAHQLHPARRAGRRRRARSRRGRSRSRGSGTGPARRPSPARPRRGWSRGRRSPSRCRRSSPRPTSRRGRCTLTTPLAAAFMPDVPDASSGRRGLFSQTSTPWTRNRAMRMS